MFIVLVFAYHAKMPRTLSANYFTLNTYAITSHRLPAGRRTSASPDFIMVLQHFSLIRYRNGCWC
jgi:hypothetical protein